MPERGLITHAGILAWRVPWVEEPGGLQSVGSDTTESQTPLIRHAKIVF